jgi:hypothetical protein
MIWQKAGRAQIPSAFSIETKNRNNHEKKRIHRIALRPFGSPLQQLVRRQLEWLAE